MNTDDDDDDDDDDDGDDDDDDDDDGCKPVPEENQAHVMIEVATVEPPTKSGFESPMDKNHICPWMYETGLSPLLCHSS